MNILARLEYELVYYDSAVHRFNHYTTRTPTVAFIYDQMYLSTKSAGHIAGQGNILQKKLMTSVSSLTLVGKEMIFGKGLTLNVARLFLGWIITKNTFKKRQNQFNSTSCYLFSVACFIHFSLNLLSQLPGSLPHDNILLHSFYCNS